MNIKTVFRALGFFLLLGMASDVFAGSVESENVITVLRTHQTPLVIDINNWLVSVNRIDTQWNHNFECGASYESVPPTTCQLEALSTDRVEPLRVQLQFPATFELAPGQAEQIAIRFSNNEYIPTDNHGYLDLSIRSNIHHYDNRKFRHIRVFYDALNRIAIH